MKNYILFLAVILFVMASCVVHKHHPHCHHHVKVLPPGHAKKLTGSKSAKAYAPGQRKKVVRH